MTWFKVDDSFHSNAKVLAASPAALGLWVVAGSWSAQNLTEGYVPSHVLPRLMPRADRFATELIKVGLWERTENGFQFHDWTEYNPTRSEALAVKERQSSGGAIGNHRRWHEAKGKVDPTCRYCRNGDRPTDRSTDRSTDKSTESVASRPSRPDPSRPESDGGAHSAEGSGSQSVSANARTREALRWLSTNYGLTDQEAAVAWKSAEARARDEIKNPVRYLERMAERGHLADIIGAIQTATAPDPAAAPEAPDFHVIEHQPTPRSWRSAVDACRLCDHNGMTTADPDHPKRCDHQPPAQGSQLPMLTAVDGGGESADDGEPGERGGVLIEFDRQRGHGT